jgi:hypothetical protein
LQRSLSKEDLNMGMRISTSSGVGAMQSACVASWQQRQQGLKDMFAAVQAGDLGAAQKAFSTLGPVPNNSPLAKIGQALSSGDMATAQQTAQQAQASRGGHRHHHQEAGATGATPAAATGPAAAASGIGSILNLVA